MESLSFTETQGIAKALGVELHSMEVRTASDLENMLQLAIKSEWRSHHHSSPADTTTENRSLISQQRPGCQRCSPEAYSWNVVA